jgi:hypothetical protein
MEAVGEVERQGRDDDQDEDRVTVHLSNFPLTVRT